MDAQLLVLALLAVAVTAQQPDVLPPFLDIRVYVSLGPLCDYKFFDESEGKIPEQVDFAYDKALRVFERDFPGRQFVDPTTEPSARFLRSDERALISICDACKQASNWRRVRSGLLRDPKVVSRKAFLSIIFLPFHSCVFSSLVWQCVKNKCSGSGRRLISVDNRALQGGTSPPVTKEEMMAALEAEENRLNDKIMSNQKMDCPVDVMLVDLSDECAAA